ncbi:DNA internalization-related competence protein ComEC/Rec2 [uncultured Candidatus Thioglobus sp.]|nr:DNA internalization-related competence protein ComEC/Rec2 [uncultured Candidatus Thioglobus sp.]
MLIYALSFGFGIVLFSLKNTLQISPLEWLLFLGIFLTIITLFKRYQALSVNLAIFLLGFAWMGIISIQVLKSEIKDEHLNKPILVTGKIVELPEKLAYKTKFIFKTNSPFKGRLKLAWYDDKKHQKPPNLHTGDTWQLLLKIKDNNGYQNLGGLDYEKWLFYQRIDATGYVRHSIFNQRISANSSYSINQIRQKIQQDLRPSLSKQSFGGVINALIIGDRSFINDKHWELFKSTNTTHLSVISGLHIGLISGFVFLLAQLLWRQSTRLTLILPAQVIGAYFGLLSAFLYALIAGFSIPTGRAFIMASVVFVSIILRRHHNTWQLYGLALILVLANNPLSVFSVGFWLSFYVVAVIIYASKRHQQKSWLYRLIYIQLLISIATLPLIAWFFSGGSILSPIANLIAIPVFSFITTPFSLMGALLSLSNLPYLGELCLSIANQSLVYLSFLLEYLQQLNFNLWHYTPSSSLDLIALILVVLITILPKQLKLLWLSPLILALILFAPSSQLKPQQVLITTLDVGQGLANIVQTKNHTLLFDTGAYYRSGFNLAEAVILPYLNAKNIQHLDKIIISHGDNDHIGGLKTLLKTISVDEILTSVPEKIQQTTTKCQQYQQWQWDGVKFEILSPAKNSQLKSNNASCVLKISNAKHSLLLTGDIEKKAERYLVKNLAKTLNSDVMIAPHHGSKSSSTEEFLNAVSPTLIVVSSGFQNRYRHPHKTIIKRYQGNGIKMLQTACAGQIDIILDDKITVTEYRKTSARYYMRQCQ